MTVYRVLADIVDVLRTGHLEHEAIRAEMATKKDLAAEIAVIRTEMATKKDLAAEMAAIRAEMVTKQDLAAEMAAIRAEMVTKQDWAAEMAAIRAEMATKAELAEVGEGLKKLGLDFEAFRHDTKITLEMISELMARTGRHDKAIASLDRRIGRVEKHLKLQPLPNGTGDQ
jgi:hypothetical protein